MVNHKILYLVTKSVLGGASRYTFELALEAKARGFDVTVAAGGEGGLRQKLKENEIAYFAIPWLERDIKIFKETFAFFHILRIIFKTKPDVLHSSSPKVAGLGGVAFLLYRLLSWRPSLQVVYTVHGWVFNEPRPWWQRFLLRNFSRLICLFYKKIIVLSRADYDAALKLHIAPRRKLVLIHNGIDPESISFLSRDEACQKLGLNPREIVLGAIGEFTKNKGQEYLIGAIGLLKAKEALPAGRQVKAIIIGWGEEKKDLELRIKDRGLRDEVKIIDDLSPAAPYLKAFDIFVLPSLKEGLPYTLLEAGLAELPVIATNVGGNPEIIADNETGLLVAPADPDALAKAIERLLNDQPLGARLAQTLHQKIIREFSKKEMLEKTFTLYVK